MSNLAYIQVTDIKKYYGSGSARTVANDGVNFSIEEGEFVVILGPSGAGKSTILNILGGMDYPDSGQVIINGMDIAKLNKKSLTHYRRYQVGFIFQNYNLIPNLTAQENVELSIQLSQTSQDALYFLEKVGLKEKKDHFPAQLSGGEQQRVSVARAVAKSPNLLLCDEPTGALDIDTGKQVLELLHEMCRQVKKTVIVITHNQEIAKMADRVIRINNGKAEQVLIQEHPLLVSEISW